MQTYRTTGTSLGVLMMLVLVGVATTAVPQLTRAAESATTREYLDLSKDPVVPGGISEELATRMLSMGWFKSALKSDVHAHVRFRKPSGEYYYRDGWVRAGTEVFSPPNERTLGVFEDFEMIGGCGNFMLRSR